MLETPEKTAATVAGVALLSWLLIGALRRYALRRGVLDNPNDRSSHRIPTPRGGGAGLVAAAITGFIVAAPAAQLDWRVILALLAVAPTAVAGWLDDHGSLPVAPRLTAHVLSGLLLLPLALDTRLSPLLLAVTAMGWILVTVSAVNVVNFMDGIDGLIGLQALLFGLHLLLLAGTGSAGGVLGLCMAASSAGFLFWNKPPARIFLGDVGSGAVAVTGLIGGILVWREGSWPFVSVFLPLLAIFLDASVAIARRIARGEPLTVAHRSHLYQRLANERGWGHARVTLMYAAVAATGTLAVLAGGSTGATVAAVAYIALTVVLGWILDRGIPAVAR